MNLRWIFAGFFSLISTIAVAQDLRVMTWNINAGEHTLTASCASSWTTVQLRHELAALSNQGGVGRSHIRMLASAAAMHASKAAACSRAF